MEEVLLDLAEAIRFLKQERGFSHVILQGHSGGGGVVAYYQNQAKKSPPQPDQAHACRRSARSERV